MTDWARLRADVARESLTIATGSTASIVCPKCVGGTSGERSMSVTRAANGAMFLCHRSSCAFRGFVGTDGARMSRDMPRKAEARPYSGTAHPLEWYMWDDFIERYKGFAATAEDPGLCGNDDGHLVFECRGFNGELLGHVTRSPDKVIKTYRATDNRDMYGVYRPRPGADKNILVVVEDCVSAMCCASHGYTGIALLGTHLTPEVREAIKTSGFLRVVVYLDPDSEAKALTMADILKAKCLIDARFDPKDHPDLAKVLAFERG